MKESHFFKSIKGEAEKNKNTVEMKPLTAAEHEAAEQKPMALKDHWLSLRQSIQEKTAVADLILSAEEERVKLLSELITPKLAGEYKQVLRDISRKAEKSKEHPQREFIDVNSEELVDKIENWIDNLVNEIKGKKKETSLDENDIEELRAQCWLLFDSIGNVLNTRSLEKDITEFQAENKFTELDEKEQKKQNVKLIKKLQDRYPFNRTEIEVLVALISSEKDADENYSLKILTEEIAKLWKEYKFGEKKGDLAKISLGYLLSRGASSFAPSLFQNLMTGGNFNGQVFLEYFGLNKLSDYADVKIDIELEKFLNGINHQINEKITNSLFFQEFEFIHEKSLGEIYMAMERGKNATQQLVENMISRFTPTMSGIVMSLLFLTKINPVLGAIGMGSLPVMYGIAKKQRKQIHRVYEKSKAAEQRIFTRLDNVRDGFEQVKTSSNVPIIAKHVEDNFNAADDISMERTIMNRKMWLKRDIPNDVAQLIAAATGTVMQQMGAISGGAVLSNIMYTERLTGPIRNMVELYFNDFSRNIQDIQHAEKIFGEYEKLDLPEGEREKERIPVSELENFDIAIKNLRYKNILRDVNLVIEQGEFLTIAGASGAGKSTLLRNLVGLYRPDNGGVEIGGTGIEKIKKYGKESIYSVMSYSNQEPQIFDGMTLRENLLLWSREGVGDEKIKKVLGDLHLDRFSGRLDEEVKNLSGGEKVRIGVARTLIKGAKIMLLDEPTASLDSQAATEVRKVISEINEKYPETTIICVSHDDELIKISQRSVNMAELQK